MKLFHSLLAADLPAFLPASLFKFKKLPWGLLNASHLVKVGTD